MPELVPNANGRGAIYQGGVPGNKGGGRLPDRIKQILQEGMHEAAPSIVKLAKGGENVSAGDQINAFDKLGKYGVGEAKTNTGDDLLKAFAKIIATQVNGEYLVSPETQLMLGELLVDELKG